MGTHQTLYWAAVLAGICSTFRPVVINITSTVVKIYRSNTRVISSSFSAAPSVFFNISTLPGTFQILQHRRRNKYNNRPDTLRKHGHMPQPRFIHHSHLLRVAAVTLPANAVCSKTRTRSFDFIMFALDTKSVSNIAYLPDSLTLFHTSPLSLPA